METALLFRTSLVLTAVSLTGGFCSGLLGVGGAVVLIPLLLSIPPLLGAGELSMNTVAGITMLQVLAASAMGMLAHRRGGYTHLPTVLAFGMPMGLTAFVGAAVTRGLSSLVLEIAFGVIVALALLLLCLPTRGLGGDGYTFTFNRTASALCGGGVGFISGMIGAGGGFVLVPVMTGLLGIPLRVAIGSSLGIMFLGALMGAAGKIVTGQVEWRYLLPVIAGSLPAAWIGARVSRKLPARTLRWVLVGILLLIFAKTWSRILL